jgi:DNA invertase Pin-like site-specific DNA recombinase
MRIAAYVRVSTDEQHKSGAGVAAQRASIASEAARRGWQIVDVFEDNGYSARDLNRPGIQAALAAVADGDADALVVAKLDRLSRSMLDFTSLMARAAKEDWAVIALDVAVDTSTPSGEAMANVLATFAQLERRLIGQRTADALAIKREQGIRLGRPAAIPPKLAARIRRARTRGATLRKIAGDLNASGVPTPHGGREWRPSSLERVLMRSRRAE